MVFTYVYYHGVYDIISGRIIVFSQKKRPAYSILFYGVCSFIGRFCTKPDRIDFLDISVFNRVVGVGGEFYSFLFGNHPAAVEESTQGQVISRFVFVHEFKIQVYLYDISFFCPRKVKVCV